MRNFLALLTSLVFAGVCVTAAADSTHQQKFVEDAVDPQVFVEKASSSGTAEVALAKMALEKSTQDEVRHFAQMMIESHTVLNQQLRELAESEGLNIADEPTLM